MIQSRTKQVTSQHVPMITAGELKKWLSEGRPVQLIDVREKHEVDTCSLGACHIPMDEIVKRYEELRRDIPVVIHCRSGKRSAAVVSTLQRKFRFTNLYTLEGGILAWGSQVDQSLNCQ